MASWNCDLCHQQGTDIGSFVRLTGSRKAHLKCYRDAITQLAVAKYLLDKAEEEVARKEAEEVEKRKRAKAEWEKWGRCTRCGVKLVPLNALDMDLTLYRAFGEHRARNSVQKDVCHPCILSEINERRAAARSVAPDASKPAEVKSTEVKPEPQKSESRDRFELLDLE